MPLPINLPKRGLSKDEAAEYCGVSLNTLRRHGPTPAKIGDRIIYDRRVLDRWLDELGGLISGSSGGVQSIPLKKRSSRQSMHVKLRYVERRVDRTGGERWYWHRRGHKLTRLPADPIERMVVAEQLNAAADKAAYRKSSRADRSAG